MEQALLKTQRFNKTRVALLWMHLANEPFVALFTLLGFILKKDLGASTLQLSVLAITSPVLAVFSFYWSAHLTRHQHKLLPNLIGAWILGRLPFLFFPWFNSVWYLIFAAAVYKLFYRAGTPALMEILKQNVEKNKRAWLFSSVYLVSFLESLLLGLFVGKFLDLYAHGWKILLVATALLSISSVIFQKRIPLLQPLPDKNMPPQTNNGLIQPWKDCLYLMKTYPAFATFQWGFMIGGFGLMLINPALIIYYADTLSLSHENLTTARYIFMGLGVLCSTFLWRKAISTRTVSHLTLWILVGFGLFPLVLLCAQTKLLFLYIAFLLYGIAQAGSHLLWHLSGTLFASEDESSSKYTGANVLMVGIRGLIGPVLGGVFTAAFGPVLVLTLGAFICFLGAAFIFRSYFKKNPLKSS